VHTRLCMLCTHAYSNNPLFCILMCHQVMLITMPRLMKIRNEIAENLVFNWKLVWFGFHWFGLVWFLMLQFIREVLVSMHTKFELSRFLACPTIENNICSVLLLFSTFCWQNLKNRSTSNAIYSPTRKLRNKTAIHSWTILFT